jgi:oligopeptidase A
MYADIHKNRKKDVDYMLGELQGELNTFIDGCWTNSSLLTKFKSLANKKLTAAKKQIHDSWIDNFFQEGQDIETKKNYAKLSRKLQGHINTFRVNNEQLHSSPRNTIFVPKEDKEMLLGMRKEVLTEAAKKAKALKKSGWLFNITESTTYKIIRECKNRQFRMKVYKKYQKINQAGDFTFKNGGVLKDILHQKHRIAQLMGKDNYAELVLSKYMMNTPKEAYSYLDKIEESLLPTIKKIETEICDLAKADKVRQLRAWDVPYYFQRINAKHNATVHKFEDYFCFEDVLPKFISFLEKKFDLSIQKENFNAVGNKEISYYRIKDNQSQRHGFIFLSPYDNPRKGNCYQLDLLKSDTFENNVIVPHIQFIDLLIAKGKKNNSKMSFYDMYTMLHEFGHALHSFFEPINDHVSKTLQMSWDLIEMPSQFLEHLVFDYDLMREFSSHHTTGEKLEHDIFLKIVENQQFFDAYHTYCNIQTYKTQLWVHENFKPYSMKNLQEIVETKLAKKGIIYNIAKDDYMTYSDYNLDYGPSGYIYLYSAQLAYQLYKKNPQDLRKIFTKTFNSNRKKDLKSHMEKNFDLHNVDIHSFITKGLPINIYH